MKTPGHKHNTQTINIVLFGKETKSIDALRAILEVSGHTVSQAKTVVDIEKLFCENEFEAIFLATEPQGGATQELFETLSLISPELIVVGYGTNPTPNEVIQFIRSGGSDYFSLPKEFDVVNDRLLVLIQKQQEATKALQKAHKIEKENDELSQELANNFCETKKKMQQVALGAEFQTLVSQELDVESMLRTALGYTLTRVGAMNAAVYLREGSSDWGIGAFINYDRQPEQFQSLVDVIGPAVSHTMSTDTQIHHNKNGSSFADVYGLDPVDFSGSEVVSYGCYAGDTCMAVVVLFRDEARPFDSESIETIETLRTIFGQQLGTILRIHQRADSDWPSESYGDDDWSIDKAA